jgi:hypothetical protein
VQFNIAQMETSLSRGFQKLKFKDLKIAGKNGTPELPYYTVIVVGKPADIKINTIFNLKQTLNNIRPTPAMPEKLRCKQCKQPSFIFDPKIYKQLKILK